jgi:hypothetical protein
MSPHLGIVTVRYVPFLLAENRLTLVTQFSALSLELDSTTLSFVPFLPVGIILRL